MNKEFKLLAKPYIAWLFILAILPIFVMIGLSFMFSEGLSFEGSYFTFDQFSLLGEDSTLTAFGNSLMYASLTAAISLVLGYFVAYNVYKSNFKNKFMILTIFILPMWSNLLLRSEALANLLDENNIINDLLSRVGLGMEIGLRGTPAAVIIGLVLTYLPFMILPIYTALEKIDYSLEEAALDLGLTKMQKFWKVIFPLSLKGVATGTILVFLPSMSGFAIPEILGSGNILLIGNIIEQSFRNMDYNLGSLLSIFILIFILGSLYVVSKVDKEGETLL
ncbi:MAG: ABC transporter permease [Firmicutes bacterium]|nr:ABC transporter permease [Bacillota bacterium]